MNLGITHSEVLNKNNESKSTSTLLGKMISIEPGEYFVGRDMESDNKPLRQVFIKGFYIDIHPVTNKQYLDFLDGSGYQVKGNFNKAKAMKSPLLPATELTFEDAEAYARFYKKRLPTEWEWEIVARSLKKENLYISSNLGSEKYGHFLNDKKYFKLPVFSYPPNKLGVYGMAGNVFEWTNSIYPSEYLLGKYYHAYHLKVLRGGAWTNRRFEIRATTRTPFPARRCLSWIGFRCVSDSQ